LEIERMTSLEETLAANQARIDQVHRCVSAETALLVVDMQRGFLEPGAALEVPAGREIIPNIRRLIDTCRAKTIPVIFSEFAYSTSVPCMRGDPFGVEHLPARDSGPSGFGYPSGNCQIDPGSGEGVNSADIVAQLAPRPGELIVRGHTYDKFYGTPLDLALRSRGIRYLLITGVVTDICVNATLVSASTREYRVTAVTDGVATLWPDLQQACFTIWKRKFARLRTTDEVVEELR
jgi:ureidoacrylate peracid hydrolase